jgi:hypothetical protein
MPISHDRIVVVWNSPGRDHQWLQYSSFYVPRYLMFFHDFETQRDYFSVILDDRASSFSLRDLTLFDRWYIDIEKSSDLLCLELIRAWENP